MMYDERRRGMPDDDWGPPRRGRAGGRSERDRERGRGRGHGPGGRGGPGFGPGPIEAIFGGAGFGGHPFGRHGFGRGSRARRGDVRAAILDLLAEREPWNGYQIIQEIADRTQGVWRPSAGSVYPALQQLEDEGLISTEDGEGRRRMYRLTAEGRTYAEEHADELRSSWDAVAGMADEAALELRDLFRQVLMAVMEVARSGSAVQVVQARKVLAETRKSLYQILAGDDETDRPSERPAAPEPASAGGTGGGTADGTAGEAASGEAAGGEAGGAQEDPE
jgi:DNA-binding PadR family transcriptional regulator